MQFDDLQDERSLNGDDWLAEANCQAIPRRILFADEKSAETDALTSFLRGRGHQVHVVDSLPEELEIVPALNPSVVFLAVDTPELNGWELCRHLRKQEGSEAMAIFGLLGEAPEAYAHHCRVVPFDAYLTKPIDLELAERLVDCCPP